MLLRSNSDINVQDICDETPLHWAVRFNKIPAVECIAKHCKIHKPSEAIEITNNQGETALHLAACLGHSVALSVLMKYNANLSATDNNGNTVLHLAVYNNQSDVVEVILLVKNLKTSGITNVKNKLGYTARQLAVLAENNELVTMFDSWAG